MKYNNDEISKMYLEKTKTMSMEEKCIMINTLNILLAPIDNFYEDNILKFRDSEKQNFIEFYDYILDIALKDENKLLMYAKLKTGKK